MTASDWRRLCGAAAVGALIAFPAGLMLGDREADPEKAPVATEVNRDAGAKRHTRNVYSPQISKDPYVVQEQRRVVDALEAECRHSGNHCAEAEQARRWLQQQHRPD